MAQMFFLWLRGVLRFNKFCCDTESEKWRSEALWFSKVRLLKAVLRLDGEL